MMTWTDLTNDAQIATINEASQAAPVLIFKHSTRCSISNMALGRLDKMEMHPNAHYYYLDLLQYRSVSNTVAEHYSVHHESPQVLLVVNGECVYEESHNGIMADDIATEIANAQKK